MRNTINIVIALLLMSTPAVAQTTVLNGSSNWSVILSQFEPDPATCIVPVQVGNIVIQSQNLSNGPVGVYRCTQMTGGLFSWQPIDHLVGSTLPPRCTVGQIFFKDNAGAGSNIYGCTTKDVWTAQAGGGGGAASFDVITSGTNTQAAMVVSTGASLSPGGTGTINANRVNGVNLGGLATGILKNTTSTGAPVIAASGVDYAPATSGSGVLKGNGSGGTSLAGAGDIVALFTGCSGTQYLGADGACHNGAGSGTVSTTGAMTVNAIITSAGTGGTVIQTAASTATLDTSGNASFPGTLAATGHTTFEGVTSTGATGTGNLVYSASPTLTGTAALASGTFSGTLQVTGHTTFEGVASSGATGTGNLVYSASPTLTGTLTAGGGSFGSTLAVTGHTTFEGVTSTGATGTGRLVYDGSPTLITPTLGAATATSINKVALTAPASAATLTIANNKTLTASNSLTLAGTDGTTLTFPATSASMARTDAAQSFTAGAKATFQPSATTAGLAVAAGGLPSSPVTGDIAVDSGASNALKWYNGSSWVLAGGSGTGCTTGGSAGQLLADNGLGGCTSIADFVFTTHTMAAGASAILNLGSAAATVGLKIPTASGAAPTANGQIAFNSTNATFVWGSASTTMVGAVAATGTGTATACSNQVVTTISSLAVPTCSTITSAYTSGTFAPDNHNLLSSTHADTTASSPVRGGGIFAVGGTPKWTQVAHSSATGGYYKWNGTDIVASTGAAAGTGACTNQVITAENADSSPTCSTITSSYVNSTIALTGTDINTSSQVTVTHLASALPINQGGTGLTSLLSNAVYVGNGTSAMTSAGTGTASQVFHGGGAGTPTWGSVVTADIGSNAVTSAKVDGSVANATTGAPATLTDAATVTWAIGSAFEANSALTFTTHGGSRTLNITGPVAGGTYVVKLVQDATGGEGLTLGTGCTWKVVGGGSGAVTLSTGASAIDVLAFYYDGANCLAALQTNFN